jgi:hypothetical protein
MPATEEGTKRLLTFFLYGMMRAAESLGNPTLFMRKVVEEGLRKFLVTDLPTFEASEDARATCEAFTQAADASGFFDSGDTVFRGDGDTVSVEIGDRCPSRRMCTARHDEGKPVHCIRTFVLAEMLRIRRDEVYDWKLNRFGRPGHITLTRSRWEES